MEVSALAIQPFQWTKVDSPAVRIWTASCAISFSAVTTPVTTVFLKTIIPSRKATKEYLGTPRVLGGGQSADAAL
jgi:hypothetical protein